VPQSRFAGRWVIIFALVALSLFYALSIRGAVGSSFSLRHLAQAITEDGSFTVNRFAERGMLDDHAQHGANRYVHWPPGPVFFGLPFYLAGSLWENQDTDTPTGIICGPASRVMALFFCLCAVLTVFFLALSAYRISRSTAVAVALAAVFALGFYTWPFAATFTRHVPAAMLLLASLYFAIQLRDNPQQPVSLALHALSTGLLPLFDYSTVLVIPVLLLIAGKGWRAALAQPKRLVLPLALLVFGPVLLGVYNWVCFGAPWTTSYTMSVQHEWSRSFFGTFSGNPWEGVKLLLLNRGPMPEAIISRTEFPPNFLAYYRKQVFTGLLWYAPLLWLALPGWIVALAFRRTRMLFVWLTLILLPTLLLMGAHRTVFGGSSFDPRYIYHVTPLLFLGIAALAGVLRERSGDSRPWLMPLFALLIAVAGMMPLRENIVTIMRLTVKGAGICPQLMSDSTELYALFPNLQHVTESLVTLSVFWLIVAGVALLIQRMRRRAKQH